MEEARQPVVLTIERGPVGASDEGRVYVMVWSAEADPQLLVSEQFRSEAQLRQWLQAIGGKWVLGIRWTAELEADAALRRVIADAVGHTREV